MTYIILYESEWHATFGTFAEAQSYYHTLVEEDGKYFDITLAMVVKENKATDELEYSGIHKHAYLHFPADNKQSVFSKAANLWIDRIHYPTIDAVQKIFKGR